MGRNRNICYPVFYSTFSAELFTFARSQNRYSWFYDAMGLYNVYSYYFSSYVWTMVNFWLLYLSGNCTCGPLRLDLDDFQFLLYFGGSITFTKCKMLSVS